MSRPKYWWYASVVRTIRAYPALTARKRAVQEQAMVANYGTRAVLQSGKEVNVLLPRSCRGSRTTEDAALRTLSAREEADLDAVERAIERMRGRKDGDMILAAVRLVDWEGHSVQAAAERIPAAVSSVKRWRRRFIYAVAKNMGYLT